jgi:hypothetical protein
MHLDKPNINFSDIEKDIQLFLLCTNISGYLRYSWIFRWETLKKLVASRGPGFNWSRLKKSEGHKNNGTLADTLHSSPLQQR